MGQVFDTSRVSPSDAAVTLRSLRRRFAEVVRVTEDEGAPARAGGRSAVEHAAWVATAIEASNMALRHVAVEHDPLVELPRGDADSQLRAGDPDLPASPAGDLDPEAVLARLGRAAETTAATIANIHGSDWNRSGHTDAGPVTALGIARLVVRIGIEHLRAAEATVAELTHDHPAGAEPSGEVG